MLGSMVVRHLDRVPAVSVTASVRSSDLLEDARRRFPDVTWTVVDATRQQGAPDAVNDCDVVVNAIGVIKPFIQEDDAESVKRAIAVNATFPHALAEWTAGSARVIQIATDCVYSGRDGGYAEQAVHDALDVYGKTKSLGEVPAAHVTHLRCSIIGPEAGTQRSLLEWFLSQPQGADLKGFTNHRWNGVTTLAFAKICAGIVMHGLELSGVQHVVPGDVVDKHQLLGAFAATFSREDLHIAPSEAAVAVDRTLSTDDPATNDGIWKAAGYDTPPTVADMLRELAALR